MALNKKITTQYGCECEYWKITILNTNWINYSADVIMEGFLNETARQNKSQPLDRRVYHLEGIKIEDNLVEKGYLKAKEDEFTDAEDC